MSSVPHSNLRKRVVELLSNSAAAAGLELRISPASPDAHREAKAFLAQHPTLVGVDPWAPILAAQKVD
jgi:hypothetical protein